MSSKHAFMEATELLLQYLPEGVKISVNMEFPSGLNGPSKSDDTKTLIFHRAIEENEAKSRECKKNKKQKKERKEKRRPSTSRKDDSSELDMARASRVVSQTGTSSKDMDTAHLLKRVDSYCEEVDAAVVFPPARFITQDELEREMRGGSSACRMKSRERVEQRKRSQSRKSERARGEKREQMVKKAAEPKEGDGIYENLM